MINSLPFDLNPNGRYNKTDTAAILGISRTTLDKLIANNAIKFHLKRRPYSEKRQQVIFGSDIIRFFNSQA